jgi:hypothetical protein
MGECDTMTHTININWSHRPCCLPERPEESARAERGGVGWDQAGQVMKAMALDEPGLPECFGVVQYDANVGRCAATATITSLWMVCCLVLPHVDWSGRSATLPVGGVWAPILMHVTMLTAWRALRLQPLAVLITTHELAQQPPQ